MLRRDCVIRYKTTVHMRAGEMIYHEPISIAPGALTRIQIISFPENIKSWRFLSHGPFSVSDMLPVSITDITPVFEFGYDDGGLLLELWADDQGKKVEGFCEFLLTVARTKR